MAMADLGVCVIQVIRGNSVVMLEVCIGLSTTLSYMSLLLCDPNTFLVHVTDDSLPDRRWRESDTMTRGDKFTKRGER